AAVNLYLSANNLVFVGTHVQPKASLPPEPPMRLSVNHVQLTSTKKPVQPKPTPQEVRKLCFSDDDDEDA
ncbi:MAG TPA: hypothetical protein VMV81_13375, partial [Phycisphaerae bacterium]|nr:hypothetical protein [Phycisphaerae bacterium]